MKKIIIFALTLDFGATAYANVIGVGTQNFNSTPDGLDFVTVQSSSTLEPGIINTGLFFNYAVNSLPYFQDGIQGRLKLNDTLLSADLNGAVGIANRWEAGLSIPAVLAQTVGETTPLRGYFSSKGLAEIRFNTKYQAWTNGTWGVALIATVNFNKIIDDPYAGSGAGPTYNLEVAIDRKFFGKLAVALNIGHRWRLRGTPVVNLIEPLRNQFIVSVGASYLLAWADTKLIGEIYSGFPVQKTTDQSNRGNSSMEVLAGLKHDYTTQLAFHGGLASKILSGVASPDWRLYTGVNYTFGPVFKKKSAITNETPDTFVANIVFEFDSDRMTDESLAIMALLSEYLRSKGGFKQLTIEGHTDSIGNAEYNRKLSLRRADAIKKYLVEKYAFNAESIHTEGWGASKPVADNGNFQGRQANRRVEFKVLR